MDCTGSIHRARAVSYGPYSSQYGELTVPNRPRPAVVCLLHGGFWRMPYACGEITLIAQDLAARGYAVWNLEYRRLDEPGGGWPGTLQDVAAAIDHVATLLAEGVDLDLRRVIVVGHSAGGHLALWSAVRDRHFVSAGTVSRVPIFAAVGLAPIADLAATYTLNAGNGAVSELLGGSPVQYPERYAAASPAAQLPLGGRQLVLHGTQDEVLPIEQVRGYAQAARAAGDQIELVELIGSGHMDYLDPSSAAHAVLCTWLTNVLAQDLTD